MRATGRHSEILEWYGRRWLLRLPFWANLLVLAPLGLVLLVGLTALMLTGSVTLWQAIWLSLFLSGLVLLTVLLALRLAAWRAGICLRLDREGRAGTAAVRSLCP